MMNDYDEQKNILQINKIKEAQRGHHKNISIKKPTMSKVCFTATLLLFLAHRHATDALSFASAGGSHRAASSCVGILRGFHQKQIIYNNNITIPAMNLVKYNSAISGGSIPALLYTYSPIPTDQLLETDRLMDPKKITPELLNMIPDTSLGSSLSEKTSFLDQLRTKVPLAFDVMFGLRRKLKVHSYWSFLMYNKHFKPYNIPQNKYFTSNQNELIRILEENPKLKEKDFILPRSDVTTTPIIGFTLHGTKGDSNQFMNKYNNIYDEAFENYQNPKNNVEMNSASMMTQQVLDIRDEIGNDGNLPIPLIASSEIVETKFDGKVLFKENNLVQFPFKGSRPFEWGKGTRFSLETLLAMATNFPGTTGTGLAQIFTNVRKVGFNGFSDTFAFADGGTNDLFGIPALVEREEKKIFSIYNFNQNRPNADFSTAYADIYKEAPSTDVNDPSFENDFQKWLTFMNPRFTCYFGSFGLTRINQANFMNHIFEDPNLDRLKELMIKFNSLFKAGEPLVATLHDLKVIDNPFWGIKGGKTVDLTLLFFNMPKKFSEQVSEDCAPGGIDDDGRFKDTELRSVPELPMVSATDALKYTKKQINMVAYLGSWIVHHGWNGLRGHDGKIKFEGFAEMFV